MLTDTKQHEIRNALRKKVRFLPSILPPLRIRLTFLGVKQIDLLEDGALQVVRSDRFREISRHSRFETSFSISCDG